MGKKFRIFSHISAHTHQFWWFNEKINIRLFGNIFNVWSWNFHNKVIVKYRGHSLTVTYIKLMREDRNVGSECV